MQGFGDLESILFGISQDELLRRARLATPQGQVPDKAMHEMGSEAMSNRFGLAPAFLAGLAREGVSGIGEAMQGQPFFSNRGFDVEDMQANARGLTRSIPRRLLGFGGGF